MNLFNRAFLFLSRNKGKSLLLLAVLTLLLILVSVAISIQRATINTDLALRSRLLPVVTVHLDQLALLDENLTGEERDSREPITTAIIRELGDLPYVNAFNFSILGHQFFSEELIRVFDPYLFTQFDPDLSANDILDWRSYRLSDHRREHFVLQGVHNPDMIDIVSGLIELVDGRTFTEHEVNGHQEVAIVSQAFLDANQLVLGDTLQLDYHVYNEGLIEEYAVNHLLAYLPLELEVIGVFDHELNVTENLDDLDVHFEILNRIYVPNPLVESSFYFAIGVYSEASPSFIEDMLNEHSIYELMRLENIIFLLDDPLYLENFSQAVSDVLPTFWTTSDLSNTYADIASSMRMMNEIANGLLIGAIISAIIIVGLLLLLFVRDRKKEFGIYRALGASRKNVITQIISEVFIVGTLSIICALFIGNYIASHISTMMIKQDLVSQIEEERYVLRFSHTPEGMGFRHEITHEEMIELYDTSLDVRLILEFGGMALIVIFISTTVPMVMILKMDIKFLLTDFS